MLEALAQSAALVDAPDDAAGFKAWLARISERVANASSEGDFLGFGGVQVLEQMLQTALSGGGLREGQGAGGQLASGGPGNLGDILGSLLGGGQMTAGSGATPSQAAPGGFPIHALLVYSEVDSTSRCSSQNSRSALWSGASTFPLPEPCMFRQI